jgi:hypothetical protein
MAVSFDGLRFLTDPEVCVLQVAVMFDSNAEKKDVRTTSFSKKLRAELYDLVGAEL